MWYVYILKCKDESHYTGCTNNLKNRLKDIIKVKYTTQATGYRLK